MRMTEPLKCGSSCWSLAPSWCTEPRDSRKVPITHCGWAKSGPALRGLAQGLRQNCTKSWQALTEDQLVWYSGVGQVAWASVSATSSEWYHFSMWYPTESQKHEALWD